MTDLFEQRLRSRLHAASLPVAPDRLRDVLYDLPATMPRRPSVQRRPMILLAAALALVTLGAVGLLITGSEPSPSPVVPDTTGLLADYPWAAVRLEKVVGPVDAPVSAESTPERIEVGRLRLLSPFMVGVACVGPGELLYQINAVGQPEPFMSSPFPVTCDGHVEHHGYPSSPAANGSNEQEVAVTVAGGASWRLAIGEFAAEFATPPRFADVPATEGWSRLFDLAPTDLGGMGTSGLSHGLSAAITVPQEATLLVAIVQCQGEATAVVRAAEAIVGEVACPTEAGQRIEFPVTGGQQLDVAASSVRPAWIRLVVEANSGLETTYPAAPPLPVGVAETPYAVGDGTWLGLGTVGSNRQTVIDLKGAGAGVASGDLVAVAITDETAGEVRLDLYSISTARPVGRLAEVSGDAIIPWSWVDVTHGQVYYAIFSGPGSGLDFHRVAIDGSGDRVVATVLRPNGSSIAELAGDDSLFVVDSCRSLSACTRQIVDTSTGETRTIDLPVVDLCRLEGVADGFVVHTVASSCSNPIPQPSPGVPVAPTGDSPSDFQVVATTLDGGASRVLVEGDNLGTVVRTDAGPRFVYMHSLDFETFALEAVDVNTGDSKTLVTYDSNYAGSTPWIQPVRLPPGWVLLASDLRDVPDAQNLMRAVPELVNVLSGERIQLPNLPHS
jgi:hypothetical protein